MKKITPWMAAMMVLAIGLAAHAAEEKIAHLDLMHILNAYQQGDPAVAQFREEVERRQKEFEIKRAAIKEMREKFDAQEATLSEEEIKKQKMEVAENSTELVKIMSEAQLEMKAAEEFLTATLVERVRSAIQEFGKENGYSYIVDSRQPSLIFADDSLNVTEAVLKKLEAGR